MKTLSFILIFLLAQLTAQANMANPVTEGTWMGQPFVSDFVDVEHEDLDIKLSEDFSKALFRVRYHIRSSRSGTQIPFLFYASEYQDGFTVTIDGQPIKLQEVPSDIATPGQTKFEDFAYFFETSEYNEYAFVELETDTYGDFPIYLSNMLYFEIDIPEGQHLIEVQYRASQWADASDWVTAYSFRYALSPAKYWKSFGSLDIRLDARAFANEVSTNLGPPKQGRIDSIATWHFEGLPVEILQIQFQPPMPASAKPLIAIGPIGLAALISMSLAVLHFFLMVRYRKKQPNKKWSPVLWLGCLVVPLSFALIWLNYFGWVENLIGEHAGGSFGYLDFILILFLFPIILMAYSLLFWQIDRRLKSKNTST